MRPGAWLAVVLGAATAAGGPPTKKSTACLRAEAAVENAEIRWVHFPKAGTSFVWRVVVGAIHVSRLYRDVFRVRSLNTCLNTSRYITVHVSESKLSHNESKLSRLPIEDSARLGPRAPCGLRFAPHDPGGGRVDMASS